MKNCLLLFIIGVFLMSCKEKADINKLYNETEGRIELEFKYAIVDGKDYSSVTEEIVYHVDYDKIKSQFHIWTIRLADVTINETFEARINKFHCTETQMCFDNRETRVVIENAGESYIVHVYKLNRYSKFDSRWEDWITFHNSDERALSARNINKGDDFSVKGAAIETKEPSSNQQVFTVVYATSDDGFVNIREQPSSKARVLKELHVGIDGLGEGVLIEKGNTWCKVSVSGIIGWAYTKYVGFQTWYKGTGDSVLVANLPKTPIFENAEVDEENYKFTDVEKGTIIADSFKDLGNYYALLAGSTYLYVRKEDVKIVTNH